MEVLYARCCGIDIHKEEHHGLCSHPGDGTQGTKANTRVRHHDFRDFELRGLVARSGRYSRSDGIYWGLLATRLEPSGRAV